MNNLIWHTHRITPELRAQQKHQMPVVLWFTGLSGSGKSTIANLVDEKLYNKGYHGFVLDGDNVRHGLNGDLGFSDTDRVENIRRIAEVATLMVEAGLIVSAAFISPFANDRALVRERLGENFIEVYVSTTLSICERRDPKGLYRKARAGGISHFTGIDSPYEVPTNPDLVLDAGVISVEQCAEQVMMYLLQGGWLRNKKDEE
ncbi:adenylyl-sulfate kinase [Aeromonas hydrophila]|uniref:adenylyl-sulfate kinase n=1 Tax=Aeromonas hydrophila TaxID=644 RepID=UPI00256EC4EF|nr:adenylyl-sulfate kinase [Aeromonas hydrophila]MDL5383828.1 adenylyl-sulfate kinase [Aeromonas hydrophila]